MDVSDARERKMLRAARGHARCETAWLVFHVVLTALVVWLALDGVAGVPAAVLWFAAGVLAGDAVGATRWVIEAWREVRALAGCTHCRRIAADLVDGHARRYRCGWSGHERVAR